MSAEHDPPGPSESPDLDQAEPSPPPTAGSSEPSEAAPSTGLDEATSSEAAPSAGDEAPAAVEPEEHRPVLPEAGLADDPATASTGSPESAFDRRVDLEALETLEGDLALIEAGMSHLEADDLDAAEAAVEQLRSGEAPPTP